MTPVFIVGIVFGSLVLSLAIVGGTILAIVRGRQRGWSRKSRGAAAEDDKMMQDIYQGLLRMEKRVEALETILMDLPGGGTRTTTENKGN